MRLSETIAPMLDELTPSAAFACDTTASRGRYTVAIRGTAVSPFSLSTDV